MISYFKTTNFPYVYYTKYLTLNITPLCLFPFYLLCQFRYLLFIVTPVFFFIIEEIQSERRTTSNPLCMLCQTPLTLLI